MGETAKKPGTIVSMFRAEMARQLAARKQELVVEALQRASAQTTIADIVAVLTEHDIPFGAVTLGDLRPPAVVAGTPPGPTRKRGVTSKRIVEFVTANPGVGRATIMEAIGLKGGTTSSQLRWLCAAGKLRHEGVMRNWLYFPVQ